MNRPDSHGRAAELPLAARIDANYADFVAERPSDADEDVHMLAAVVDHVIARCSTPGDIVLDPFAGFGTTLSRAIALGRRAIGVELLPERVAYLRHQVPAAHILAGDARSLRTVLRQAEPPVGDGGVHLILSSPPYMTRNDHEADPLTGYEDNTGDYERYLAELGAIAAQCARLLVPGGLLVWNVADIHYRGETTHLIADCAAVLAEHLHPVGSSEIVWDRYPHDLIADKLLVFQRAASREFPRQGRPRQ